MTNKTRDGRSLKLEIHNATKKNLVDICELSEEQADRMIRIRRTFPPVEDRQQPSVDAYKLWQKIGKPYKRFNRWAEEYISPEINVTQKSAALFSGQIEPFYEKVAKTQRKNYTLSRDFAMHLAMQARTDEGREVRQYFLDVEHCVYKLCSKRIVRKDGLIKHDNAIYHAIVKATGDKHRAKEAEMDIKGLVPEILSGVPASEWREEFGKGIRDVLSNDDLVIYDKALGFVADLFSGGIRNKKKVKELLTNTYSNKIDFDEYV